MRIDRLAPLLLVLGLLQACVAVDPQQTQNEKASAVNVQLGIGYLQQNNLELANEKLSKALRQDPNSVSAHTTYAILQDRLNQSEQAEYHYKRAVDLDPKDSGAANNYGWFLCRNKRELEAEEYFIQATRNPLYRTPEVAYTNAAVCMFRIDRVGPAREYLRKALASKPDFPLALLVMADVTFKDGDHEAAKIYLDRYHLVARASAMSLWLAIRNTLELDTNADVAELGARLAEEFPDSQEYREWLKIQ